MNSQKSMKAVFLSIFLVLLPAMVAAQEELPVISVSIGVDYVVDCVGPDGEFVACGPPPILAEEGWTRALVIESDGDWNHEPLSVNLKIEGTAINGVDYVDHRNDNIPLPDVVTIEDGERWRYLGISAIDDELVEGDETIIVTVLEGEGYRVSAGDDFQATETIIDNDKPPVDFHINAGLNDSWFNPEVDDQGFVLSVFPDAGVMLVSWFTYELIPREEQDQGVSSLGDDNHRWFSAQGEYSGNKAELDVWSTLQGGFGKKKAVRRKDGTMIISFNNCNDGDVTYTVQTEDGRLVSGTSHIERIVTDNVPLCEELDRQSRTSSQE